MRRQPRALIIGGGIGGFTTAIALQRTGFACEIYEQAPALTEVGAGLTLWANAITALAALGLAPDIVAAGATVERTQLRSWRGELLSEPILGRLAGEIGSTTVCIHRADLHEIISRAVDPAMARLGSRCSGFTQTPDGVTAYFEDGHAATGDLLIGADGVHSVVRRQLVGDGEPRYAGYTAWRGVMHGRPAGLPDRTACELYGSGVRFGLTPLGGGRTYWFATANRPPGERAPAGEQRHELLRRFDGWWRPVVEAIETTEAQAILRNDVVDRNPIRRWGVGRVTLLGDAAHPTTPNLGQGACLAIEDAVVLARSLAEADDIPAGLRSYERRRRDRTARVLRLSRQVGWIGQLQHPLATAVRARLLRHIPETLMRRQAMDLLAYDARTAE